jgi:hypothetical protein
MSGTRAGQPTTEPPVMPPSELLDGDAGPPPCLINGPWTPLVSQTPWLYVLLLAEGMNYWGYNLIN